MERLTKRINGYAHGIEGRNKDNLTGTYCRGNFECTACIDKLAEYEDLEEQRKMLKLPCVIGDTVYQINKNVINSATVTEIGVLSLKTGHFVTQITCLDDIYNNKTCYLTFDFNRSVFFTRKEAEQALKEVRKND